LVRVSPSPFRASSKHRLMYISSFAVKPNSHNYYF
jgi:hypothetical protein